MIEFRKINLDRDIEKCLEFRADSFQVSFGRSWESHWSAAEYRSWIINFANLHPRGAVHMWLENTIIGQLEFSYEAENAHINLYYLLPEFRGNGYGRIAHKYIVQVMKSNGCKMATLRVSPTNSHAIAFYEQIGWVDQGAETKNGNLHRFSLYL